MIVEGAASPVRTPCLPTVVVAVQDAYAPDSDSENAHNAHCLAVRGHAEAARGVPAPHAHGDAASPNSQAEFATVAMLVLAVAVTVTGLASAIVLVPIQARCPRSYS